MPRNIKKRLRLFFFAILLVFGFAQLAVFESTEYMAPLFLSTALGSTIDIFYFTSHVLLSNTYIYIYKSFPLVSWYEVVLYFYVSLSVFTVLYVILEQKNTSSFVNVIRFSLLLLFTINSIVFLQYTRVAFMLGTASTLLFLGRDRQKTPFYIWSVLLYGLCILTRPEVGIFVLLLQWLIYFVLTQKEASKIMLGLHTTICAAMLLCVVYDRLTTTSFIKQYEPELCYQLFERGNIVPLASMSNKVDSAKYLAVVNTVTDPNFITIPFLQRLVKENAISGVSLELVERTIDITKASLKDAKGFVLLYFAAMVFLYFSLLNKNEKQRIKRLLFFNLLFWCILIVTIFEIKMEKWVFESMLMLLTLTQLYFISAKSTLNKKQIFSILLLCITGSIYAINSMFTYHSDIKNRLNDNKAFFFSLKERYTGKVIMPGQNIVDKVLYHFEPFSQPNFKPLEQVYLFDCDVLHLVPDYNAFISKTCHCDANDYAALLSFLANKGDNLRFISTPQKVSAITSYCEVVRHKTFIFTPIDTLMHNDELNIAYTIKYKQFSE